MPTPQVNPGQGTKLQLSIASTFTTIAQRVELTGPTSEVGTAETTHLDSTVKTYRGTILDNGEMSGRIWWDPQDPTHVAMYALLTAVPPAPGAFKLQLTDAAQTIMSFSAVLSKFEANGMTTEENLAADFTAKITGAVVVTHT